MHGCPRSHFCHTQPVVMFPQVTKTVASVQCSSLFFATEVIHTVVLLQPHEMASMATTGISASLTITDVARRVGLLPRPQSVKRSPEHYSSVVQQR